MANVTIARAGGDPFARALNIATAVEEKWRAWHGRDDVEVPVSVVAVLSLVNPPANQRDAVARELIGLTPDAFGDTMRRLWGRFLRSRSDLISRAWPLVERWFDAQKMTPETVRDAHAVAVEALRKGLFTLTDETRWKVDLLGVVLTVVRSSPALQARGQYYTPPDGAEVLVRILRPPRPGQAVNDPSCGTGGMFRAAAAAMRSAGDDPATVSWEGNDTDDLAVACCAINTVSWGLGTHVLLGVGNTLTADWRKRAIDERDQPIILMHQLAALKSCLGLEAQADVVAEEAS